MERLCEEGREDLRLGLLGVTAARQLVRLPAGKLVSPHEQQLALAPWAPRSPGSGRQRLFGRSGLADSLVIWLSYPVAARAELF